MASPVGSAVELTMEEMNDITDERRINVMSKQLRRMQTNTEQMQRNHDNGDDSAIFSLCTFTVSNYTDESDDSLTELDMDDSETHEISLESLQTNYSFLLDQLETDIVLDKFHESNLFDDAFLETCRETPNRRRRVDMIIKEISSIAKTKTNFVLQYLAVALAEDQSFILEQLKDCSYEESATEKPPEHTKFITVMRKRIIRDIEPRTFLHKLVENKAISLREHEDIDGLLHRKDKVKQLLCLAEEENIRSAKVIKAIIDACPKLYKEYQSKAMKETFHSTERSVGTAIKVKIAMKSENMTATHQQQFMKVEQRIVENYKTRKPKDNDQALNDLIEECRVKFEGLKMSCIVIQLLALDEDSIAKVLFEVKNDKIVKWFLSNLDESNLEILHELSKVQFEISVSTNKGGNFNSHISMNECICMLDRKLVLENKDKIRGILADETLLKQLEKLKVSTSTEQNEIEQADGKQSIIDIFEENDLPKSAFCVLEEHLKSKYPAVLESLIKSKCTGCTDSLPSTSDIDKHTEYLIEELEIRSLVHTIRSFNTEASRKLLLEFESCHCRRARAARFLEFVKHEEDIAWFWTEVKKRQDYIFDTIMSSLNQGQLESDLLAVKLINDTIKEEVDPVLLWQNMDKKLAEELGMIDFQHIMSRKRKAQYMLNRISLATICEFVTTLRRCGYEHLYSEIKAGALSKYYVCPRIHKQEGKGKCIFTGQFNIRMKSDDAHNPNPGYSRLFRHWSDKLSGEEFYSSDDLSYINGSDDERFLLDRNVPPHVSVSRNECKYEICLKKYLKLDFDLSREGVRNELRKRKCNSLHSQRNPKSAERRRPVIVFGELK